MYFDAPDFQPSKVLILGASGRIGRLLRKAWDTEAPKGMRCVWQSREKTVCDDLCLDFMKDKAGLRAALESADAVLVLAGVTPSSEVGNPRFAVNVEIAETVLEAAEQAGGRRVLLTSTAAVYGTAQVGPNGFREAETLYPISDYGKSKVEMEQLSDSYGATEICSLRIGNIAGADQLLGPGRRDVTIDVFPDGRGPQRTYLGPRMLANVLAQLLTTETTLPSVLNIGGSHPIDMLDLLCAAKMPYRARPAPEGLPEIVSLDCSTMWSLVNGPEGSGDAEAIVDDWFATTGGKPA